MTSSVTHHQFLTKLFESEKAFELYGGVAGFFDYGPIGCMLKNNIIGTDTNLPKSHPDLESVLALNLALNLALVFALVLTMFSALILIRILNRDLDTAYISLNSEKFQNLYFKAIFEGKSRTRETDN